MRPLAATAPAPIVIAKTQAGSGRPLTNRIAIWILIIILVLIVGDAVFNGWAASGFLARKFLDLLEWVKFWR